MVKTITDRISELKGAKLFTAGGIHLRLSRDKHILFLESILEKLKEPNPITNQSQAEVQKETKDYHTAQLACPDCGSGILIRLDNAPKICKSRDNNNN